MTRTGAVTSKPFASRDLNDCYPQTIAFWWPLLPATASSRPPLSLTQRCSTGSLKVGRSVTSHSLATRACGTLSTTYPRGLKGQVASKEKYRDDKNLRQGHHRPFGGRSVQRLHLRGRQDLAPHQSGCRSQQLRTHMLEILNAARKLSFGSSTPCIIDTALATTRPGNTSRPSRGQGGGARASNTAHGAANSAPNSCRRPVRSSRRNTGAPAGSPTRISICSLRSTASIS